MRAPVACLLAGVAGCARPQSPSADPTRYEYAVVAPPPGSWRVDVEATIEGAPSPRLVAPEAQGAVVDVRLVDGPQSRALARGADGAWTVATCRARCVVRYGVELDRLASTCGGLDCAHRVGDAVLGSAAAWMLRPDTGDAWVRVRIAGGADRFATGLRRDPNGGAFVLRASELSEASYTAFGGFRRARLVVGGAALQVVLMGPTLAMGDDAVVGWVGDAASCVARFFGRFPVDATVFVVPIAGVDHVVFGRVMSLAGASAALFFGADTPATDAHRDWVVVHELFHLGTPSYVGEGHWLEEGLATYYEPILRERAGWTSEAELWAHFGKEMPRGLPKEGEPPGLEQRSDIDSTYWGGALFAFLADLRIRGATRGARSLDDVLRAVLARAGDATHAARVADFVRTGDEIAGGPVLSDVYERFALRGEHVDLDALWRRLGVGQRGAAAPTASGAPDGPLAPVRRAIAAGVAY